MWWSINVFILFLVQNRFSATIKISLKQKNPQNANYVSRPSFVLSLVKRNLQNAKVMYVVNSIKFYYSKEKIVPLKNTSCH